MKIARWRLSMQTAMAARDPKIPAMLAFRSSAALLAEATGSTVQASNLILRGVQGGHRGVPKGPDDRGVLAIVQTTHKSVSHRARFSGALTGSQAGRLFLRRHENVLPPGGAKRKPEVRFC
jgi:hypothetical protein